MAFLSPRFAVLACLCAALPLTLPNAAEAAHIHGGHSVDKHTSSHHGHHRTRAASIVSHPTGLHRHDDKNEGHEHKLDRRLSNFPPLLRRYRVPDREEVYEHQIQDPHEDADHKVPKSAFARSRYRQGSAFHSRRSSIYVPGEHGNKYIVSRTPRGGFEDPGAQFLDTRDRRQLNDDNLASGTIDIMGSTQLPGTMQRLASLMVDATPIDWSTGQSPAKAFQLNASTNNQTQFIMVPTDDATGSSNKYVALATEVFDANSAEMVMYCATYNSDPESTSSLLMTPCAGVAQSAASADDTADPCDAVNASSSDPHQSQIFSYDPSSGKIEPISATTSASNSASCDGAKIRRDSGNVTTSTGSSSSARSTSSPSSAAPTPSASQQAEKVVLVYVAGALEVPASAPSAGTASASNITSMARASDGQVAVLTTTTTLTTTVVSTVTDTSNAFNRTVSPARAAVTVSVSAPSTASGSTTAAPSGVPSAARLASSLASTPSVTTTSGAPEDAHESLEVEVVGISAPSVPLSSLTTSAATTTATTIVSSGPAGAPLNPQAVASSITNEMPRQ